MFHKLNSLSSLSENFSGCESLLARARELEALPIENMSEADWSELRAVDQAIAARLRADRIARESVVVPDAARVARCVRAEERFGG